MAIIEIADVGPIRSLCIPLPDDGGVVVLRGRNALGKTQALEAVECLVTGRGKLEPRDRQPRGVVEGLGARITIGRSTRRSGEAEVLSLEGRLSIADLVDPGLKDPALADANRIKALVSLSKVDVGPERWAKLLGGQESLKSIVQPGDLEGDPVTVAGRVKRRLEVVARQVEGQAEHAAGRARGLLATADGVDLTAESDAGKLDAALEAAIIRQATTHAEDKSVKDVLSRAEAAWERLEQGRAAYQGLTPTEAAVEYDLAQREADSVQAEIERLRAELNAMQPGYQRRLDKVKAAQEAKQAAESHEAAMTIWRDDVEAGQQVKLVPQRYLAESAQAVQEARQAIETGLIVRQAKAASIEARGLSDEAATHSRRARQLREAAKNTDLALSDLVAQACQVLRVEGGRLVTDTSRGITFYAELSMGERWKLALDLAATIVGKGGLLTCSQEAWESLDPVNRRAIAEHCIARGVVLLTAEATGDEEVVAEAY